jgi:hypothetical protein
MTPIMETPRPVRDGARILLAGIRLVNGAAALFAPGFLLRRLGLDPDANPGAYYAFRMFGIRTILIALDLVLWGAQVRRHAVRLSVLVHGSDTLSAAYAGLRGQLPARAAVPATIISAVNVLLAVLSQEPGRSLPRVSQPGDRNREPTSPLVRGADGQPRVTVEDLLDMSLDERDEAFRAGEVGAIPDGDAEGTVLAAPEPLFVPASMVDRAIALVARWLAWTGKVVDARKGELVNKVTPLQIHAFKAKVYKAPSWFDNRAAIILDYSQTSLLARRIRDEIRLVGPGTYLGQVYWGPQRVLQFALVFQNQLPTAAA